MITVIINEKGIERKLAKEEVQPRNPPKFEMSGKLTIFIFNHLICIKLVMNIIKDNFEHVEKKNFYIFLSKV